MVSPGTAACRSESVRMLRSSISSELMALIEIGTRDRLSSRRRAVTVTASSLLTPVAMAPPGLVSWDSPTPGAMALARASRPQLCLSHFARGALPELCLVFHVFHPFWLL